MQDSVNPPEPSISFRRVLVVEDSLAMWRRLARILSGCGTSENDLHHAGSVANAKALAVQHTFSLALIDIGLPDGSGVDLIAALRQSHPDLPCVVVSAWGEPNTILAALRAGAVGYLLKEREDAEIAYCLRSIECGGAAIDPFIAKRILQFVGATTPASQDIPEEPTPQPLSTREKDILQRVSEGLSNTEIADALSLSKLTVESHTRNIYRKLAVGSRTAAVHHARLHGWLH